MASKGKKPATKKTTSQATVTRIKASDSKKPTSTTSTVASPKKAKESASSTDKRKLGNPFTATTGYFKGAWYELRQVRWPNRRATWSLTAAMLVFTAFFVALILLLDALFKYVFQLILG